jgi:hypothetical protein
MKITAGETIHLSRGITVHAGPEEWPIAVPPGPGLGIGLDPEMFKRRDVTVESIGA